MRTAFYREDLARVHHSGFAELAERAARHLGRALARRGIRRGTVVDLGCGSGELARSIGDRGLDVIGVDVSAAMIRRARRTAPHARFRVASLADFELPRCDAVTALGEVISYLPPSTQRASTARLFRRVARALRPGGLFLFDVLVRGRPPMRHRTWKSGGDWAVLVDVSEDVRRGRVRREITTFVRDGARYRRRSETHVLRVFGRAELVRDLERAGFRVKTSLRLGEARLGPRRLGFTAIAAPDPPARRSRSRRS
jgi:SAM-dependent methyltransferase